MPLPPTFTIFSHTWQLLSDSVTCLLSSDFSPDSDCDIEGPTSCTVSHRDSSRNSRYDNSCSVSTKFLVCFIRSNISFFGTLLENFWRLSMVFSERNWVGDDHVKTVVQWLLIWLLGHIYTFDSWLSSAPSRSLSPLTCEDADMEAISLASSYTWEVWRVSWLLRTLSSASIVSRWCISGHHEMHTGSNWVAGNDLSRDSTNLKSCILTSSSAAYQLFHAMRKRSDYTNQQSHARQCRLSTVANGHAFHRFSMLSFPLANDLYRWRLRYEKVRLY
jgi:hypothetical protein